MKILFITLGIFKDNGGIGKFLQRVVRILSELMASGEVVEVCVIALWDTQEELASAFPNIHVIGLNRSKVKTLLAFIGQLLTHRYSEIVFGHILLYPLFVLSAFISGRSRRILFVYGDDVWEKPPLLKRLAVRHLVDDIVGVSNYTIRKMVDSYRIDGSKFQLLYCASDFEESNGRPTVKEDSSIHLLSVSRLSTASRGKNIDKVIKALPALIAEHPKLTYDIVGGGNWKAELEELTRALELDRTVHFWGEIGEKDLEAQYKSADLFILPSVSEGFGIVFLEAWSYHLPVVTSNQGAAPEVVRNGLDGYCVDPTPGEITKAITTLLSNPELRKEMGASGYLRLKEHFTHDKFSLTLRSILLQ